MYKNQAKKKGITSISCFLFAAILLTGCTKRSWEVTETAEPTPYGINEVLAKGRPGNPAAAALTTPLGTWWWSVSKKDWDTYLNFAQQNGVTEIYFYTTDFSATTSGFIQKATGKGIKIFLLAGDYQWIYDRTGLISLMTKYTQYQNSVGSAQRFSGIHLDVEPHQDPQFQLQRATILQQYIDFVTWVCAQYKDAGSIDFDIPFWLDDEVLYNGTQRRLYEAVISEATRVFIMSYRDTAAKMYDVSKEEIAFAVSQNKQIFLGAETASSKEGDQVTYYEEGKAYMYGEFQKLKTLCGNINYGVSVHHIKSWYSLKK
ncbi:hypothetical protein [Niabella drilacis]|uniref:Uncharacterized protein n=1 Tax=Niabella drilacis (strain DSM 25811 / CCM 8410 / CCUG 62505 / LMG 26954 / E90) TaxID=1285928 RepID=A0A1G6Z1B9_NIADE|nr:hypothetical protein [Niabella drilacis]SDD96398.1 hypothetical protein SAMN04487894_11718 [Niabella drilacis]